MSTYFRALHVFFVSDQQGFQSQSSLPLEWGHCISARDAFRGGQSLQGPRSGLRPRGSAGGDRGGATVYQHVMHSGEVSHSKDPGEGCVLEVVRVGMGVGPQCISM